MALLRPVFGPRGDLLGMLLAIYGLYHVVLFLNTPPEDALVLRDGMDRVSMVEIRAAPLIAGMTFAVLLLSLIWSLFSRIALHLQETPKEERHFLRSFYESLLGLPPRG